MARRQSYKTAYKRAYFDEWVERPIHLTEIGLERDPTRRLARHAADLASTMEKPHAVKKVKKKKKGK